MVWLVIQHMQNYEVEYFMFADKRPNQTFKKKELLVLVPKMSMRQILILEIQVFPGSLEFMFIHTHHAKQCVCSLHEVVLLELR